MNRQVKHSSLVNAADLVGVDVHDRSGGKLGAIRAVYLDERSGQVEFVCLACGGLLGLGETFYPAPWSALQFDPAIAGYRTALSRADLDAGPGFGETGGADWARHARAYYEKLTGASRDDAEGRHFTHGAAASTADMAVVGEVRREDTSIETPHTRPIEPTPADETVDHLAEKVERSEDRQEALLDEGIEESFPASDPVSVKRIT